MNDEQYWWFAFIWCWGVCAGMHEGDAYNKAFALVMFGDNW